MNKKTYITTMDVALISTTSMLFYALASFGEFLILAVMLCVITVVAKKYIRARRLFRWAG